MYKCEILSRIWDGQCTAFVQYYLTYTQEKETSSSYKKMFTMGQRYESLYMKTTHINLTNIKF